MHGLVNNAANNPTMSDDRDPAATRLERFDVNEWDADLRVGLTGAFLCAKHFSPLMPEGSSIVNISSDLGLIAPDQRLYRKEGVPDDRQPVKPASYSAVKAGLIGLTRYLATYWEDGRIRCNALCPGGVENGQDPVLQQRIRDRIPMGRMATHEEYHGALVFLLSPASAYVNGAVLAADGGRTTW
ncbi:MAG: SDR family oxidoreductase, partial [Rhodothermales bacterium]|nr:SDR family oxidoreductase [Rhodothermales bacterium]